MELNISEVSDNMYDQIPENVPIKIIKKDKVRFNSNINEVNTIINTNANTKSALKKVVRPYVPEKKPQVSYDDILSKMGMFVADGQLHLLDNQPVKVQEQIKKQINNSHSQSIKDYGEPINANVQNSYIYNKYFSNEKTDENQVRVPKTLLEYRNMLIQDIIQKQKLKQIKSTKLIMPTSNINFAPYSSGNMNKLFKFSNR